MNEKEQSAAASAVCLRLSKVSGVILPSDSKAAIELFAAVAKFIVSNKRFRWLTTSEVALAASLNAAGEFPNRVKHYNGELNLDYIGELLNEYCRHKAKFNLHEKLERESTKFLPYQVQPDPFFWEKEIELRYQQFLQNRFNFGLWLPGMYNKLADIGFINHNTFVFHLEEAYRKVSDTLREEYSAIKSQGGNLNPVADKWKCVQEYKYSNNYVLPMAKRLAVKKYFNFRRSLGSKNLFVEEK